jgi:predicted nucleotidyltransferase component of viral defense system
VRAAPGDRHPYRDHEQAADLVSLQRVVLHFNSDLVVVGAMAYRAFLPEGARHTEDIDLVRTTAGPIGPILDRLRKVLEPWLGGAGFAPSQTAPKLRFRVPAEDDPSAHIRLKIEINTDEIEAFDPAVAIPFEVANPWFAGSAAVETFSREEILATKLRALLQRSKGRDLFDLDHGLRVFDGLDKVRVTEHLQSYLRRSGLQISRAEAEQRMFAKLSRPAFIRDLRPLLPAAEATAITDEETKAAFIRVFAAFIAILPGAAWARSEEMRERFGVTTAPET